MSMEFDSHEELYFAMWLDELVDLGYVAEYKRAETIVLSPKVVNEYIVPMKRVDDKLKTHTVLNRHVFTPDFEVRWNAQALGLFITELNPSTGKITTPLISQNMKTVIEVKADFDANNMTRLASVNIKMAYQVCGVFVNMVKINSWFGKTFCPKKWIITKRGKVRKVKFAVRMLEEFINLHKK